MSPVGVSIVINNFNYCRFLRDAIDSALAQQTAAVEVIVVDDGSTDSSRDVIASYGPRLKSIFKVNGGQASCFNAGARAARGDVILFLDADDRLQPRAVGRIAEAWQPGHAMGYYMLDWISEDGTSMNRRFPKQLIDWDEGANAWQKILERGAVMFPPTSGNFFSAWALRKVGEVPEAEYRLRADVYLHHTVPFLGGVLAIHEPLAEYRIHGRNSWYAKREGSLQRIRSLFDIQELRMNHARRRQKLNLLRAAARAKGISLGQAAAGVLLREQAEGLALSRLGFGAEDRLNECSVIATLPIKQRIMWRAYIWFHLCLPRWVLRKLYRASAAVN